VSAAAALWRRWRASPLFWILVFAALARTAAIGWGLPASDGWDDDGVAPRNFLVGLVETYTPGHHFTYPPFHMFILAVLSLPGIVAALLNAPSFAPKDVIAEMIHVPYMTYFAVVARLVSAAFSLGTIVVAAKMGALLGGKRAGWLAAAALALNGALAYYGQVTNLDGPSLFWAMLSLFLFMRVMAGHDLKSVRWACLAAAAAVATKDQTYAVFALALPLGLIVWFAADEWARANAAHILKPIVLWGAIAVAAVLLIDGAFFNPHGFADRIALLTGSASQDYAEYQNNLAGRMAVATDMAAHFSRYYPVAAIVLLMLGIVAVARRRGGALAAGVLPLLAALSFTIAFNFVALRTETRFVLPQSVFLAVAIGLGAELLISVTKQNRWVSAALVAVAVWAGLGVAGVHAAFWLDPRYDAEAWLRSHVRPGDGVEIYGLNAYLPRLPANARVSRVGQKPLKARNPLPRVTEVLQPYGAIGARNPRFLVVTGFWVQDYLASEGPVADPGRRLPKVREVALRDVDARGFFGALFARRLPYRLVHRADYSGPQVPDFNAYESLKQSVYIFEREPVGALAPIVTAPKSVATTRPNPLYRPLRGWTDTRAGAPFTGAVTRTCFRFLGLSY
jgi:4-amino-4-deoxy-L-arabinose transferase-like glycosyltransferase